MNKPTLKTKQNFAGEQVQVLDYAGIGTLEFQLEDGVAFLVDVQVDPEYRNHGIASHLLEYFFKILAKKKYLLNTSEYLEDGDKYLRHKVEDLTAKYGIETL